MANKDAREPVEDLPIEMKKAAETRSEAIARYMRDGYKLPNGIHRRVTSMAHANFLANAGTIKLP